MAHLDISHLTGDVERRELTKQQPLSIGSHRSNDVCIDEEGVELIHCRVSWSKTAFEAVAAGVEPIDVNGNLVQRSQLKSGDVLRIGTVDMKFRGDGESATAADIPASDNYGLKPVSEDLPSFLSEEDDPPVKSSKGAKSTASPSKSTKPPAPAKAKQTVAAKSAPAAPPRDET